MEAMEATTENPVFERCKVKSEIRRKGAADSYSGDNSASSCLEDSRGSGSGSGSGRVRRRKRRRTVSKVEKSIKAKAVQIERALKGPNSTLGVLDASSASAGEDSGPLPTLHELAISEHGLINDDFRRRAWPRLANLNIYETSVLPTQEEIESHHSYNQVVLDVNRSLKRFPPGICEEERPDLQDQLTRLIVRVLSKHSDLHYYQGYHDVAITFLLVVGEQLGYHIVEKLSIRQLKDFMAPTLEKTTFLLHFMYPIFKRECEELHDFLDESEVGTIFALPWLITWFSHVLPDYTDVVRLFDFFLAQPQAPMMPVYLAAALVLHKKNQVMLASCDMAGVHAVLSRIPSDLPFEKLLVDARVLHEKYPPFTLESEVKTRLKRLEEEMVKAANMMKKRALEKRLSKAAAKKPDRSNSLVWKVIIAAVPVVLGALAWKYFNDMH